MRHTSAEGHPAAERLPALGGSCADAPIRAESPSLRAPHAPHTLSARARIPVTRGKNPAGHRTPATPPYQPAINLAETAARQDPSRRSV